MKLIAIETSTDICSISYIQGGRCENVIEEKIPRQHAEKLPLFYNELVNQSKLKLSDVDAMAVSIGPGSFTGLRIGLSYAKGLAYSHKKPIIPVPTMLSLFCGSGVDNGNGAVVMHSHGTKYFIQNFTYINKKLTSDEIQVYELNNIEEVKEMAADSKIIYYGCDKLFNNANKNIQILEVKPSSKWIGELAHQNYNKWIIEKPYKLVPDYVSPFKIG
ncbi:MAG: tRNA (adenosine(37)-N6)-threonylcarbamoyltransferase complex dimerization subunit type 1 TsaB [Candidatus Marinimicrobia bacterium]|nr:tRNA (adenosine(37)-N6)-threonylcarbamoyltransferase complex dimerization subunit type 1 TsaB [Candidatus Neomarinimicrobiota bacterium]